MPDSNGSRDAAGRATPPSPAGIALRLEAECGGDAAEAVRRILVEHARSLLRQAPPAGQQERSSGPAADFENLAELTACEPHVILSFDAALRRLESESPKAAAVVRQRLFTGLTVDQAAQALGWSSRTVFRHWLYARAWLRRAMVANEKD